jgi:hypothetical protein
MHPGLLSRGRSFEEKIKSPRNMTRDATRRAPTGAPVNVENKATERRGLRLNTFREKVLKMVTKYPWWQLAAPIHISRLMQGTALHH